MSGVLEEAVSALREEPLGEGDDTLDRVLATLGSEAVLDDAVGALRLDEPDESPETLARIQRSLSTPATGRDVLDEATDALRDVIRVPARSTWPAVAAALALALVVGAPTAWAWSSGRLEPLLGEIGLIELDAPPPAPEPETAPTPRARSTRRQTPAPTVEPVIEVAPVDPPIIDQAPDEPEPVRPRAQPPVPLEDPPVAPAPPDAETQLFAEAHRAHFEDRSPAAALAGWDRYLSAHPSGRYELEASYNRALSLARLGRLTAARDALVPFASGAHGTYRRAEAQQLLLALEASMNSREQRGHDGAR